VLLRKCDARPLPAMRRPSKIMSQHDKVIELLSSGNWICQKTFWDLYMRSPHKRRKEVEQKTKQRIEVRKCEHGLKRALITALRHFLGSGGGTRTPDPRIMIPLLSPKRSATSTDVSHAKLF
jgi:hypothetical protein